MARKDKQILSIDDELAAALSTPTPVQSPSAHVVSDDSETIKLRAQIEALLKQNAELLAKTEIEEEPEDIPGVATFSRSASKERIEIAVEPPHSKHDLPYIFVSVNGRAYQITRGEKVAVPPEVIEVLNNAVETNHYQTTAQSGEQVWTEMEHRRFAFQVFNKVVDKDGNKVNQPYYK